MKTTQLKYLDVNDKFRLVRTGVLYVCRDFNRDYSGLRNVKKLTEKDQPISTLSTQCEVIKVNDLSPDSNEWRNK